MGRGGFRPGSGRPHGALQKNGPALSAAVTEPTRRRMVDGLEESFLDTMIFKRNYWMKIVRAEMAKAKPNKSTIEHALDKAEESAMRGARYVHPALQSVTTQRDPLDLTRLTDAQLAEFERLVLLAGRTDDGDRPREGATQH